MGRLVEKKSFLVDGEFKSRLQTTAMAFGFPREVGLDMRHRLPGLSVGLAASLRSMPTAVREVLKAPSTGADRWSQREGN
jgi:hypothetical protein